jgi:hypothetical protein
MGLAEGDHIKVTASQYPFPTVCADKQSTVRSSWIPLPESAAEAPLPTGLVSSDPTHSSVE